MFSTISPLGSKSELCDNLFAGPKGEGGLDDATGQGGSGGGASYKQTALTDLGNVERESWGMESMQKGIDKVKNMLGLDNLLSGKK